MRRGRPPSLLRLGLRLVNELAEAENDKALTKIITSYGRPTYCAWTKLGYLQLDRRCAELLFQVLTEREEEAAIAIASNEPFSGWTKTFTDPRLCAAIVDRLTFGGTIIETETTSYRLARAGGATHSLLAAGLDSTLSPWRPSARDMSPFGSSRSRSASVISPS